MWNSAFSLILAFGLGSDDDWTKLKADLQSFARDTLPKWGIKVEVEGQSVGTTGPLPSYLKVTGGYEDRDTVRMAVETGLGRENALTVGFQGAMRDFDKAVELDPADPVAYYSRGYPRSQFDPDGALEDYTRALHLDPKYPGAYNHRGRVNVEIGDCATPECRYHPPSGTREERAKLPECDREVHVPWFEGNVRFAMTAYGVESTGAKTAADLYTRFTNQGRIRREAEIPVGALVFWERTDSGSGHVGVSIGGKKVVHTGLDHPERGVRESSIDEIGTKSFLGWSLPPHAWSRKKPSGNGGPCEALVREAQLAEEGLDWTKAQKAYDRALHGKPDDPSIRKARDDATAEDRIKTAADKEGPKTDKEARSLLYSAMNDDYRGKNYKAAIPKLKRVFYRFPNRYTQGAEAYNVACCYALLGEKAAACRWLAIAVRHGYGDFDHLREDADLDAIRKETRYLEILRGK